MNRLTTPVRHVDAPGSAGGGRASGGGGGGDAAHGLLRAMVEEQATTNTLLRSLVDRADASNAELKTVSQ
jgi:hypothetical protein